MTTHTTLDLMQIAGAGGGLDFDASTRPTLDLMQIAGAAANKGGRLIFRGLQNRTTLDLMQIAGAGRGTVQFVLD